MPIPEPVRKHVKGLHDCPHCRRPAVPDYLYCCSNCWRILPEEVRVAILVTARMHILQPDRRAAFEAARVAYAAHIDAKRTEIENRKRGSADE